jgi:hypothetical protein
MIGRATAVVPRRTAVPVPTASPAVALVRVAFVVVVQEDRGGLAGGFGCCFGDFAVEFLGAAAADGIGEEGDEDAQGDDAHDGECACYGGGVVEESGEVLEGDKGGTTRKTSELGPSAQGRRMDPASN